MSVALPMLREQKNTLVREITSPRSVRISLTDRCDLACIYCRPNKQDGYLDEQLDVEAWKSMIEGLVASGIRRVRITGGEPLLHPHLLPIVKAIAQFPIDDLALTTNATRLARLAEPLREAGLHRINVSLDSLDADRFARMTRGGKLARVIAGIEAARSAGFSEMKLNAVVVGGENDGELEAIVRWCWDRDITPRFLEVMMIGEGPKLRSRVISGAEMRARLAPLLIPEDARVDPDRGPAKYVRARHDSRLRVGFITGTTDTYCAGCDRLRVASDGVLRPCLAKNDGVSAASEARAHDPAAVAEALREAWMLKPDGERFKGCTEESAAKVSIRSIGG
jgi:GTP 3',8-cyclase